MEYNHVIWLLGGLVFIVLLFKSYTSVTPGHERLVLRWGRYHRTLSEGWAFIIPWLDSLERDEIDTKLHTSKEQELQITTEDTAQVPIRYSISYGVVDSFKMAYTVDDCHVFALSKIKGAIVQHLGTVKHAELKRAPQAQVDAIRRLVQDDFENVGVELSGINFVHVGDSLGQGSLTDTKFKATEESDASQTRAESEKKIALMKSEERVKEIELVGEAEAAELARFVEIFGDKERAAEYLLGIRRTEAFRQLATSPNSKLIFGGDGSKLNPVLDVDKATSAASQTPAVQS